MRMSMYAAEQTNNKNITEDQVSTLSDSGAQIKESNALRSEMCTPVRRTSKSSSIFKVYLENSPTKVSSAHAAATTPNDNLSAPATFSANVMHNNPTATVDSVTQANAISHVRMPVPCVPTYCIPKFRSAPSGYGHSVYSPYRQRVVIRPLNSDPGSMFRYVPAFNTFPMSMSSTTTADSTPHSSIKSDVIFHQHGSGKLDKGVQTDENRWEGYVKLKCAIARQRKLISQLVRIIVKDKLEKERLDETKCNSKHAFGETGDDLTNSIFSSSAPGYLASLIKPIESEASTERDLHASKKADEVISGHGEVFVSREPLSFQYNRSASSSSIGESYQETGENAIGKSSHRHLVEETTKKRSENNCMKECESDDELIERGRRALELLSTGNHIFNQTRNQSYSSLESFNTNIRKSNDCCTNYGATNTPQNDATTEQYIIVEENRTSDDIVDKASQNEMDNAKIVREVVADTETVPLLISGVVNAEPNSDHIVSSNLSKKKEGSVLPKTGGSKKRRPWSKKKLSSDEGSNDDEKLGNRRSPRKRMKPLDTNEYIRRSASKQATKKIYDILKGSDSEVSPPTADCTNELKKKTRRKLLPPKIVPIDDIAEGHCSENCYLEPVFVKEEPIDQLHDADGHTKFIFSEMSSQPLINPVIEATEVSSNDLEHSKLNGPTNSETLRPTSGHPELFKSIPTYSSARFPELRVKVEKFDDQPDLLSGNDDREQTEALDLRITRPKLTNATVSMASGYLHPPFLSPNGSDQTFHFAVRSHLPIPNSHRRSGGLVPSLMGQFSSTVQSSASSDIAPFVRIDQKRLGQDEPGKKLHMWLRKRTPRTNPQANIGQGSKPRQPVKSMKKGRKSKDATQKKLRKNAATNEKKTRRRKRKQVAKNIACLASNEIQNSEGNDDSSDYHLLKEKTKKLKKRREYRNSNLRKATNSSSNQPDVLSVNEFPFVMTSNNTSESSEIEALHDSRSTPCRLSQKSVTRTGVTISESDKDSTMQNVDSGVMSQYSTSDKNFDEPLDDDLPIPAQTISELELAIEKMREQIVRVSREREEKLLSEMSSSESERSKDALITEIFVGTINHADDAVNRLQNPNDTDIPHGISVSNGGTAETPAVKIEYGNNRHHEDALTKELNKRGMPIMNASPAASKCAGAKETSKIPEWTMRTAYKEAKEKLTRLAHQPTKQRESVMANTAHS